MDREFRSPLVEVYVEKEKGSFSVMGVALDLGVNGKGMMEMPFTRGTPTWPTHEQALHFAFSKAKSWVHWGLAETAVILIEGTDDYEVVAYFVDRRLAGASNNPAEILAAFPQLKRHGYAAKSTPTDVQSKP